MPGDSEWYLRHISEVTYENGGEGYTPYLVRKPTDKENEIAFVIYCKKCHKGVCKGVSVCQSKLKGENIILVEPCQYCLEQARKEGKDAVDS